MLNTLQGRMRVQGAGRRARTLSLRRNSFDSTGLLEVGQQGAVDVPAQALQRAFDHHAHDLARAVRAVIQVAVLPHRAVPAAAATPGNTLFGRVLGVMEYQHEPLSPSLEQRSDEAALLQSAILAASGAICHALCGEEGLPMRRGQGPAHLVSIMSSVRTPCLFRSTPLPITFLYPRLYLGRKMILCQH